MELKPPKAKKKSDIKERMWRKLVRTPLFILFLLGTTACDQSDELTPHSDELVQTNYTSVDFLTEHRQRHKKLQSNESRSREREILSDIKYLRRRLNNEIVNFVMTDVLVDGEVENRLHFNGITAKETYVGADGSGLKLRQLTDGRHLVQLIYAQNGAVQDCEYITQAKQARNFLKTLRKELKSALSEANSHILDGDSTPDAFEERFYKKYHNVTFRILRNGEELPSEVSEWLNFEGLKSECIRRHEHLKYMIENKNKVGELEFSRARRSLRENFILPGTKWCGAGQLAEKYEELGVDKREDRCCRAHDNCRVNIGAFKRRFGYFNIRPFTISHCRCDRRTKRDAAELLRIPGTKWCGKGYSATRYSQLGGYTRTDRCCRVHDLRCPFWIAGMEKKYGLYNWRVNTLMHCRCDERFRACLKLADTSVSNMVGKLFFNVVQTKCFTLKPTKTCTKRSWWGKCLERGYRKQAFLRNNLPY